MQRRIARLLAAAGLLGLTLVHQVQADAGWTAYNDSVDVAGDAATTPITDYGLGRGYAGSGATGVLKDYLTGQQTGAIVTFTEHASQGNTINWASDPAAIRAGSDADAIFGGKLNMTGNMSYNDAPGWYLDIQFSGLDPARTYTFAGTADRGGEESYADRVTSWTIIGAESCVYASSAGAQKISDSAVEFSTGRNAAGLVAQWTEIKPGADGAFTIRTSHTVGEAGGGIPGAHAYKGYAGGVFMLRELPSAEHNWMAYNDSVDVSGDAATAHITDYGLGRGYTGAGAAGRLISFQDGSNTGITARFTEHTSQGNTINWATDPATFPAGSDSQAVFSGKVGLAGNMSYNDAPGWYLDLELTGLDPGRTYTFAATVDRAGGESYADRVTSWTILDAAAFTYASSAGAQKISNAAVEFSTGSNVAGNVAQWTGIRCGPSGRIVIRTSHTFGEASGGIPGAHAYKGYAGGVFRFGLEPLLFPRWIAYNDCVDTAQEAPGANFTNFGLGRGYTGQGSTGNLIEYDTGADTGVTVTFTEHTSQGNTINWATDAADYPPGSDAETHFGGILTLSGNMSYNDAPGWYLDLVFSGLDPKRAYTFAGTADRSGGASYADRVTSWTIMGADSYTYASSSGAQKVSDAVVEFSTGENTNGYVARWIDVRPGADGIFTIRTSHTVGEANGGIPGAHAYKGYAGGLFLLEGQASSGGGPAGTPLEILRLTPRSAALDVHPQSPLVLVVEHGDYGVDPDSVQLSFDGVAVPVEILRKPGQTIIRYDRPEMLLPGSVHHVSATYADDGPAATPYQSTWSFTVIDYSDPAQYPPLPTRFAQGLDTLDDPTRGFAVRTAAPDPNEITLAEIADAEAVWDQPFTNLADPLAFNERGYYIETETVNYQVDGSPIGNKVGEKLFAGIGGQSDPGVPFALDVTALLELTPGLYNMEITMNAAFSLYVGHGADQQAVLLKPLTGPNVSGDDGPWKVDFLVEQAGLYPFQLYFLANAGWSSLEWVVKAPDDRRFLVNEDRPEAVPAYLPDGVLGTQLEIIGLGAALPQLTIDFTTPDPEGTHAIQRQLELDDTWSDVSGAAFGPGIAGAQSLQAILPAETEPEAFYRVILTPPEPVFFDDFESGAGGWSASNEGSSVTEWELGTPVRSASPLVNGPDGAYSGTAAWGTDLDDNYDYFTDISLRSPVIDLTEVAAAVLQFWNYREIEAFEFDYWDYGAVYVLDEAGNRLLDEPLRRKAGSTAGWVEERMELPTEAVGRRIRIEFWFHSDDYQPDDGLMAGWYIDDVMVTPK